VRFNVIISVVPQITDLPSGVASFLEHKVCN